MSQFTSMWFAQLQAKRAAKMEPRPSNKAPSKLSEAEIQNQISEYLSAKGKDCYYVWHRMDKPTTCRGGTPDFIGWILKRGRAYPFAIEVKKPGGKTTMEQNGELMRCDLAGGKSKVVYSLAEASAFIESL